jgi:four helix bundle protein
MAITSYQDLDVWKLAIDLTEDCYRLVAIFPRDELFGLSSQIKRASVSIPANIAEGYGRDQTGGYIQFLRISLGSPRELETHLVIAERVRLATSDQLRAAKDKCDRVGRMLRALIRSLEARRAE